MKTLLIDLKPYNAKDFCQAVVDATPDKDGIVNVLIVDKNCLFETIQIDCEINEDKANREAAEEWTKLFTKTTHFCIQDTFREVI